MQQPGCRTRRRRLPHSRRHPRDWRSLLWDLAKMVPWPRGWERRLTQVQVLQNVLGYIKHLQRSVSIAQEWAGTGHPGDGDMAKVGLSSDATQGQRLVLYEEEEELGQDSSPWLGPTEPYWETLDWEGVIPQSPSPRWKGHLGLSPSLLASPSPPASPGGVVRALFPDVYLSPQEPEVAVEACDPVKPGGAKGWPSQPRKKCVNGFIMFCCLNRKSYIRTHPGLSSCTATQELAKLWHSLSPSERRQYCLQARQFSRRHDRIVRPDRDSDSDSDNEPPCPSNGCQLHVG